MDPWQIENLLRRAFVRTKERVVSYLVGCVLSLALQCATLLALIIIVFILVFLLATFQQAALPIFILTLLPLSVGIVSVIFASAWSSLALVEIVTAEEKTGATNAFRKMWDENIVWGFVWFKILSAIFFFGLLPFNLLTLFTVLILWSVWDSFSTFVYIKHRRSGLSNLWWSRDLVNQRFWGILVREGVLWIPLFLIGFFAPLFFEGPASYILPCLLSLFSTLYYISFYYEIYKLLPQPKEVRTPTIWIILSAVGWVLSVWIVALLLNWLPTNLPKISEEVKNYSPAYKKIEKQLQEQTNKETTKETSTLWF